VLKLRKMVQDDPDLGWRERYEAQGTEEVVPEVGAENEVAEPEQAAAVNVFLEGDTAGA